MPQFEIKKKQYDELEGDQYDIVDTEHEDQVVVRYDNADKAEEHLAHLNTDPEAPFPAEQAEAEARVMNQEESEQPGP